jgi:hypothetical protein
MLSRIRSLGREAKFFILAAVVPPAGLLLESTCGGGFCSACPMSGGCTVAVAVAVGGVFGFNMIRQVFFRKKKVIPVTRAD